MKGGKFHTVVALHIGHTMSRSSRRTQEGILQKKNQPHSLTCLEGGKLTGLKEPQQNTTDSQYPPIFNEPHPNGHNSPGKRN